MNVARIWQALTSLDLTGRRVKSEPVAAGQPKQMWLELDWDWHDANLYRQRGQR